jgi:hypothetical protein
MRPWYELRNLEQAAPRGSAHGGAGAPPCRPGVLSLVHGASPQSNPVPLGKDAK